MNIKSVLKAAALAVVAIAPWSGQAATEMLDQVVAIVDDDVIMASELRSRIRQVTENLESRGVEMPPEDTLVRETLDRLILESIQMQMGLQAGVRISDAQLNGALNRIASQNRMTLEQFRARLEQEGQSYPEMREQIRKEMILQRVQGGNVSQRIQISDQEVDNFLASKEGQKLTQAEYRLVHALLPIAPDAPDDEVAAARAHLDGLLKRIRSGERFDQVIASSSGNYTFTGGDLGWRRADDLPSLFGDIAPTMAAGETSDPIRSDSGLHIINMQNLRGGAQVVSQTQVRHILVKPSEILSDDEARQLVADLKTRAEAGEDFGELAKEYSEDIGSAQEGGDLGWTNPGQMVGEFENTMDSTEAGTISDPVRSQFGWHILEVMDRREQDITELAVRGKAREYLHNRKFQEELDVWLQRIRDEAFVDIK